MAPDRSDDPRTTRHLVVAVGLLLLLTFVTGGGSQERSWGDAVSQLLAVPVLVWAALTLLTLPSSPMRRAALCAAAVVVAVPILQLLPVPDVLWHMSSARNILGQDLAVAGVVPDAHWTLAPAATLRAALSMLPALAVFVGMLTLGARDARRLLFSLPALALLSLVLGLVQLGLPQDSVLNPFQQWVPALGGVFANPNHQATMLMIAALLATGLAVDTARRAREDRAPAWLPWVWGFAAILFLLIVPMTRSRAGVIIALLAEVTELLALGALRLRQLRQSRHAKLALLLAVVVGALGLYAAIGWMRAPRIGDLRPQLAHATWDLGWRHAPLGSGMGSFVQVFEQEAPQSLLQSEYINHAHNEYVQWWLEGGVLALIAFATALCTLGVAMRRLITCGGSERILAITALVAILAVLTHSLVDYPLRTPALMTVTALLAGLIFSAASRCVRSNAPGSAAVPGSLQPR